jgi:thymidylate synthase
MPTYPDVQTAFIAELDNILTYGTEVPSRLGDSTIEVLHRSFTILNPTRAIINTPHRNNNIFATMAETLWVLAGRDDMEFLSKYLPRARDYADPPLHNCWRGAYGPRLRNWNGIDQLAEIIKILQKSPTSRRAVVMIYDPDRDFVESKDIPCLAGDTLLASPEGDITIKDLANKFSLKEIGAYPVYSLDPESKLMEMTWCTNAWKSGFKKVLMLHFDDGSTLKCTPDHKLYKKYWGNSEYCEEIEAKDLQVGDRVWATVFSSTAKGHSLYKHDLVQNTNWGNHINECKTDNSISNLMELTESEHNRLHRMGDKNPMRTMPKQDRVSKGKKHSLAMKKYWENASEERRELQREVMRSARNTVNHKIVEIESLPDEEVYDFSVPNYHNAVLTNGVFVHNCNDSLHFLIRNNKLHMLIFTRSNDIMWGWSGINTFEWSVLQRILASILGVEVGQVKYTIGSLHLYQRHVSRARKIVDNAPIRTMYELGVEPFPLDIASLESLDGGLRHFFDIHQFAGNGSALDFSVGFIKIISSLLAYYNTRNDVYLLDVPDCDLKTMAMEYKFK